MAVKPEVILGDITTLDVDVIVNDFDRICQMTFTIHPIVYLNRVSHIDINGTERGINGHGHTDNKILSDSPIAKEVSAKA